MARGLRHRPHHRRDLVSRIVEVEPEREPTGCKLFVWNNRALILGRRHVRRAPSLRLWLHEPLGHAGRVVQVEPIRQPPRREVHVHVLRVRPLVRLDDPVVQSPSHVAVKHELLSVVVEPSPVVHGLGRCLFRLPRDLLRLSRNLLRLPLDVRVVLLLLLHLGANLAEERKVQSLDEVRVLHVASEVLGFLDGQLAELILRTGWSVPRHLARGCPGEERLIALVVRVGLLAPLLGSVAIPRTLGLVLGGLWAGLGLELGLGFLKLAAVPALACAADGPRRHQKLRGDDGRGGG